jgi:hypothetical protein
MDDTTPPAPSLAIVPLDTVAGVYAALHGLDEKHTAAYALQLYGALNPNLRAAAGEQLAVTVTGVVVLTEKLGTARAMGRLRKPDGSTSYR